MHIFATIDAVLWLVYTCLTLYIFSKYGEPLEEKQEKLIRKKMIEKFERDQQFARDDSEEE